MFPFLWLPGCSPRNNRRRKTLFGLSDRLIWTLLAPAARLGKALFKSPLIYVTKRDKTQRKSDARFVFSNLPTINSPGTPSCTYADCDGALTGGNTSAIQCLDFKFLVMPLKAAAIRGYLSTIARARERRAAEDHGQIPRPFGKAVRLQGEWPLSRLRRE
jgi:hypothetical protein